MFPKSRVRETILVEAYNSLYTAYLRNVKMYQDLRQSLWWFDMKKDVNERLAKCFTCQQVKVEH